MEDAVRKLAQLGMRDKSLLKNIWAHDLTSRLRMRRKALANDMGLEGWDVGTYPENKVVVTGSSGSGGGWKGAGLLAGGGAGGVFLSDMMTTVAPAVEEVVESAIIEEPPETETFEQFMMRIAESNKYKLGLEWVD